MRPRGNLPLVRSSIDSLENLYGKMTMMPDSGFKFSADVLKSNVNYAKIKLRLTSDFKTSAANLIVNFRQFFRVCNKSAASFCVCVCVLMTNATTPYLT